MIVVSLSVGVVVGLGVGDGVAVTMSVLVGEGIGVPVSVGVTALLGVAVGLEVGSSVGLLVLPVFQVVLRKPATITSMAIVPRIIISFCFIILSNHQRVSLKRLRRLFCETIVVSFKGSL